MPTEMTLEQFQDALKAQGVPLEQVLLRCPRCGTEQSANDLIEAGAGASLDDVECYLGFSCIGRFDESRGCDWTLGGLFSIHQLEVVTSDGERHPRFMPLSPEEAAAHRSEAA